MKKYKIICESVYADGFKSKKQAEDYIWKNNLQEDEDTQYYIEEIKQGETK